MTQAAKPITIAIDGYSSTGKSTMAKQLAKTLGYKYIDTGAMYRAVTLYALQQSLFDDEGTLKVSALEKQLENISLRFNEHNQVELNNVCAEPEIREMRVSGKVSKVASQLMVREKLVAEQQAMGSEGGVVMDGRDIGSVVFPEAELKIFMTAAPEIRAKRRLAELQANGKEVSFEEVFENLKERDALDSSREESPLIQTADAIVLDNSNISTEEQLAMAIEWAKSRGA